MARHGFSSRDCGRALPTCREGWDIKVSTYHCLQCSKMLENISKCFKMLQVPLQVSFAFLCCASAGAVGREEREAATHCEAVA